MDSEFDANFSEKDSGREGEGKARPAKKKAPVADAERPSPRIRQMGQRILAEAARALAKEPAPRRRAEKDAAHAVVLPALTDRLGQAERELLVEIVDAEDRPLAAMSPQAALRQGLRFRKVSLALRVPPGMLLLIRRRDESPARPGLWDMCTGVVRVGEAREDAATRLLMEQAGIGGIAPRLVAVAGKEAGLAYDLTLYAAHLPKGLLPRMERGESFAMDRDELEGVLKASSELFSEELRWAATTGKLFDG